MPNSAVQQSNQQGRSLSSRLLMLAAGLLGPSILFAGCLIWHIGQLDHVRANHEALQLARSIKNTVDREIEGKIDTLRALASSPTLQQGDLSRFYQQAAETLEYSKTNVLLRTLDGQQVLNTQLPFGAILPKQELADHDRQALRTRQPAISKLVPGAITQSWVIAVSIPVMQNADVTHILTMSVDPAYIAKILGTTAPEPDWIIAVSDASGRLIARSQEHDAYLGRIIHHDVKSWSVPPEGTHRTTTLAGDDALRGYRWSEMTGWMIAAFVPVRVIDEPLHGLWWQFAWITSTLIIITVPLTFTLGRYIAAPIEQAARDARDLGEGKLIERRTSSLLEANELSEALAIASRELRERTRIIADNEIRYRGIFEQAAVGFVQFSLDGRLMDVNKRFCVMLGFTRDECLQRTSQVLSHPDDWSVEAELIEAVMRSEQPQYEIEKRLIAKSDDPIWVRVTSAMVRGDDGTPLHRMAVIEDITGRRTAREAAARLAATVLASHDAMISVGPTGLVETWNPAAETLFGYTSEEIIGKSLSLLVPNDRMHEFRQKLCMAIGGQTAKIETVRLHKDGTPIDVSSTAAAIITDGHVSAISVTMEDIRERKRREAQILLLNRELAHRVKNTLAVIQSIANQTMRSTPDPAAFQQAFQGRLQSLAAANDLLTQTSWEGAELGDFINRQLAPLMPQTSLQFIQQGPRVFLPADVLIPLSLALHELGTNATKHGAWSVPNGEVNLTWSLEATEDAYGTRLILIWRERNGPVVLPSKRRGFGTTIIERGIPNAKIQRSFPPDGVICTIELPLIPQSMP